MPTDKAFVNLLIYSLIFLPSSSCEIYQNPTYRNSGNVNTFSGSTIPFVAADVGLFLESRERVVHAKPQKYPSEEGHTSLVNCVSDAVITFICFSVIL